MARIGILLAAGAGARMGRPKALVTDADGTPWLHLASRALRDGGCERAVVVLGAEADAATRLLPDGVTSLVAADWAEGIAASLRAGLHAVGREDVAVVAHVDVPQLPAAAVARMLEGADATSLRQASFGGRPGHPVVVGGVHAGALAEAILGDAGGRRWLVAHGVTDVECADLFDGLDRDTPLTAG